jgi:hypothetical protein
MELKKQKEFINNFCCYEMSKMGNFNVHTEAMHPQIVLYNLEKRYIASNASEKKHLLVSMNIKNHTDLKGIFHDISVFHT